MPIVWEVMGDYLSLIAKGFEIRIHAFVLMSNHFHLLLTAPRGNMSASLLYFMRETSREITRLTGRINQTYGNRNHQTYLGNPMYFINSYKYVYLNPVRAKICERVEEYPYSSLHGLLGLSRLNFPVAYDTLLFEPADTEEALQWLNTRPSDEQNLEMKLALKRPEFILRSRNRLRSPLEDTRL